MRLLSTTLVVGLLLGLCEQPAYRTVAEPQQAQALPPSTAQDSAEPALVPLALVLSKGTVRLTSAVGVDGLRHATDSVLVVCQACEVKMDVSGSIAVACSGVSSVAWGEIKARADSLHYDGHELLLSGVEDQDAMLSRESGDEDTTLYLRAHKIAIDLDSRQIQADNGTSIQLASPADSALESATE